VVLTNFGSESETCVGSRVHLVGASISFEKNFYRLSFTAPSLFRRFGPSGGPGRQQHQGCGARRRPGSGAIEKGGRGRPIPLLTSGGDGLEREIDGRWRDAATVADGRRCCEL
jgi:hypothetical protein